MGEGLVAKVVVLADEGPELGQSVGVAALAPVDLDTEVAAQVGEVPLEGRDLHRGGQPTQGLIHGQEAAVIPQDRVDRVVGGAALLDQPAGRARMGEGTSDLLAGPVLSNCRCGLTGPIAWCPTWRSQRSGT
jgi:hypothetical protein